MILTLKINYLETYNPYTISECIHSRNIIQNIYQLNHYTQIQIDKITLAKIMVLE